MKKEEELNFNKVEWKIYKYLMTKSEWTSRKEVLDYLANTFNIHICERYLRRCVSNISHSVKTYKVLLVTNKGYKFVSKEEEENDKKIIKKQQFRYISEFNNCVRQMQKLKKSGQLSIYFKNEKEEEDFGNALKVINSFVG